MLKWIDRRELRSHIIIWYNSSRSIRESGIVYLVSTEKDASISISISISIGAVYFISFYAFAFFLTSLPNFDFFDLLLITNIWFDYALLSFFFSRSLFVRLFISFPFSLLAFAILISGNPLDIPRFLYKYSWPRFAFRQV